MQTEGLTQKELVKSFTAGGVRRGDSLVIHSSLKALGKVAGGADTIIDALQETVGPSGNLLFPTFNYTQPLPLPFYDPEETPARTGMLNEAARKRKGALRSLHPTHSAAVIGPDAYAIVKDHLAVRAFGVGSPIDILAQRGGKILLIGVGQVSNTTIHIAEEHAKIPKVSWYDPLPTLTIRTNSGAFIKHQLDDSPSCSAAFESAEYVLHKKNLITYFRINGCQCRLMSGSALITEITALLARDPTALLCNWEHCIPCMGTRKILEDQRT
jgi:aminoglycoside 3-N-acetyltransferase